MPNPFVRMQVFPKTQKLTPAPAALARQDTIDESGEAETRSGHRIERGVLERQPTERDRLLDSVAVQREHFERSLSIERETLTRTTTSEPYDNGLREQSSTLAQRDLIATVLDMKVDSRLEMQRMSQRIGRLEDLLTELVKRLSLHDSSGVSTPADEAAPVITSTITTTPAATILVTSSSPPASSSITMAMPSTSTASPHASGSGVGSGLGPILLRKRRSKSRKAPAPPKATSPEQTRLLEAETPTATSSTTVAASTSRKREFL